jgi:hypothetical protein
MVNELWFLLLSKGGIVVNIRDGAQRVPSIEKNASLLKVVESESKIKEEA